MRVLVLSQYFWPENFRVNDLSAELVARGHEVTVLTGWPNYPEGRVFPTFRANPEAFSSHQGAQVLRVPVLPRGQGKVRLVLNYASFVLSGLLWAPWLLRGRRFDAIFVFQTSPITSVIPALLLRRIKRAPLLLWVLDLWPDTLSAVGVLRSPRALARVGRLVRFIYQRCDRVLVQSRAFMANVERHGGAAERLRYFPNWAEPVFQGSLREVTPAPELVPHAGRFNVMFAGNIGEAQDFPAILDAAQRLRDECPQLRWLVVGDGRAAPMVRAELARRGLEGCVALLGRFPMDRMPGFFVGASAMLVSLKADPVFSLTIPGKVQSYLSAGVPVLAMMDGEGARVIEESGAGLTAPAGDGAALAAAVRALMALSPEQRQAMGARGRAYCEREFDRATLMSALERWMAELGGRPLDRPRRGQGGAPPATPQAEVRRAPQRPNAKEARPQTSTRVTRDTLLNVAGLGLPLLAALVCIPLLVERLGVERFGVLALVWAVSSYFGIFDLGLGRILSQQVARAWQLGQQRRCGALAGTALAVLALVGALAAALMAAGAPALARLVAPGDGTGEATQAVLAMAVATPAALLTAGLRGVLEARGAFVAINLLRLPMGLFNFIGPALMVAWAEPSLGAIAWLLCAGRWIFAVGHAAVAARRLGPACGGWWPRAALLRRLASTAGWLTLSNLASPLMGYADRFLLGLAGSAAAVAYYVTPLELVGRLAILPAALTAVLLPAFSAALASQRGPMERQLYDRSMLALFCLLWPACAGLALFAHELLTLWLGATFAAASAPLLQVLAAGALANALAYLPATLLLGAGQARRIALIHLVELPFFLPLLWWLIERHGALGAALAWLLRMTVDALLHAAAAAPLLHGNRALSARGLLVAVLAMIGFAGLWLDAPTARGAWWLAVVAVAVALHHAARLPRRAGALL